MVTCDENLAGEIFVIMEELKMRAIGPCAKLEDNPLYLGADADNLAHLLNINEMKKL